ncbi:MAG: hypothetical protein IT238_12190 [Bacteroidia bacterium]|nr:hypothetical protein [Bacteroidia bacterium]MCZ2249698.1 hypothetical protein [Bacteroidia bacterium]
MRKLYIKFFSILFFVLWIKCNSFAQLLTNNGAVFSIKSGAIVMVRTGSVNNTAAGTMSNAGTFTIEGNFENNAFANGGGTNGIYRVLNNWINNSTFTADLSQVELYGANQLITGSSITEFHRLTLTGTGIKTQTIDSRVNNLLELNDRELATDVNKMFVTTANLGAITRTTGFVSSLGVGRLVRNTNQVANYLFPVGSSVGVLRYRPIEVRPSVTVSHSFEVRLANVDPNVEGFNRNTKEAALCVINSNYFHYINRATGSSAANLTFYYDAIADGNWQTVAKWRGLPQWEDIGSPTVGANPPFTTFLISNWNDFILQPYALANTSPTATINASNASVCSGTGTTIDFNGTPNAIITYNIDGGSNLTVTLDASGNASINTGNLAANTTYNLVSASLPGPPPCSQSLSGSVTVTVVQPPNAGTGTSLTICTSHPSINLFDSLGGAPQPGGIWTGTNLLTGGYLGTYNPVINGSGTYTYTVNASSPCTGNSTATISVSVVPPPVASFVYASPLCKNNPNPFPTFITGGVGGTFSASPTGLVFVSTATGEIDLAASLPGTYTITNTIAATAGCPQVTANFSFVLNTAPPLTITSTPNPPIMCRGFSTVLLQVTPNNFAGGYVWGPVVGYVGYSHVAIPTVTTTYTVVGTHANGCTSSASVLITVIQPSNAGVSAVIDLCTTGTTVDLFTQLGGTPELTGTWSGPSSLPGGYLATFDPAVNTPGLYTYTVPGNPPCPNATATIQVNVNPPVPTSFMYNGAPFCTDDVGSISPSITGTLGGAFTATPPGLMIDGSGVITPAGSTPGTYTVTYSVPASNGCAPYTVTNTIIIQPSPTTSPVFHD